MKKKSLHEQLRYWIDCMLSKGPVAMSVLLFAITAGIVLFIGIMASLVSDEGGIIYETWQSLMYTLDAGTLSGAPTDNIPYLFLMFLATLCGLFLTSLLIGIISTSVESKLSNLRKGTSVVQEVGHTLIIGFDNNIYSILNELIEANSNKKNACIVVLCQQEKGIIEDAISSHITNKSNTRIICRSGVLHEAYALERCSVETCKSVIINVHDDKETIKILLALATYTKNKNLSNPDLRFIASIEELQYIEAANIAGEGRSAIIYSNDAIARIISNTCRQHGLSQVLTELFNFTGNELYFEKIPELTGKTFKEATMSFSNAVAVGLVSGGNVKLNPPMDTEIKKDDEIILLEFDDGSFNYHPEKNVDESKISNKKKTPASVSQHLIILGSNNKLQTILSEYSKYVEPNTHVTIVDNTPSKSIQKEFDNLEISVCTEEITRDLLYSLLSNDNNNNILLLNDDSHDAEISDSQTLLRLLLLRDIADNTGLDFSITTEMRSIDNQRLASQARVDDFVIGSNFANLIMAQISENPNIMPLIEDLLDESGSEMYMKPISDYVQLGVAVDSYILTESAARKGEIYLGYKKNNCTKNDVIVNPDKNAPLIFEENDQIVVIAEN